MGLLDDAKDAVADHQDQVDGAVEKGGDLVDEKTGGEHAGQVDQAEDKVEDLLGKE